METHHFLFLFYVLISNFISPFYCELVSSYQPSRPFGVRNNRCSRVAVPNGSVVLKHRGRIAKFTCNSGYKLIGDNIATCFQRKWYTIPSCVKDVQCPKEIPKVMNGHMIPYNYVYFKVICNYGYKLPDNVQSIYPCEEFYQTDAKPPVCQLSSALYCDFEEDTCGWNNTVPYFSWIRYHNATPSHELHTGPGGDHTTGTGHYLYIEASGLPDHEERYAKLTRAFKQVDTPEVCFVFWYHMYGFNIGTLEVYVDFTKVFSKSGNLGDKWRKGVVQRLPSDRDFYISVMATTANGFAGDIAIDDIGLVNSTDCTKTIHIDTTCKNRCFERELNPNLCKCSSECLIEGTCCTDFMHFCSNDAYTSTATAETTEWKTATQGWQISSNGVQSSALEDHSSATESNIDGGGSTEIYAGSTSEHSLSVFEDGGTKVSDPNGGLPTELQVNEGRTTSQDYLVASGSISGIDSTVFVTHSDSNKWLTTTQQELHDVSKRWPSTQQEPRDVSKRWPSTQQELNDISNGWPSTQQEPRDVSKIWSSTQQELNDDVSNRWPSTHQELNDVSNRWPSTQQEIRDVSKIWPSTQQELNDVSNRWPSTQQELQAARKIWPSAQPEPHEVTRRWSSTQQEPLANIRSTEASTSHVWPKVSTGDPVNYSDSSYSQSGVLKETSKSVLATEGIGWTSISISSIRIKPASDEYPQTTSIADSESHTEQNSMVVTHVTNAIDSSVRTATISKLTVTSEKPPSVTPEFTTNPTALLQTSTSTSSVASTVNNYQTNDSSSTASHTHLLQESAHDEFEESTQAATQRSYRHTELALEATPSADLVSPQKTRQIKWKKTYEPKGRYTFSAVKSENKTTTYVSVLVGVTAFLAAVVVAAYVFRRRRAIRFRDATEESDVLYMTSDEILDFNVARRPTPAPGHPGHPHPRPSQQTARMCQSDFSFCSSSKVNLLPID